MYRMLMHLEYVILIFCLLGKIPIEFSMSLLW